MPPSAIKGIPFFLSASATLLIAVICGTPTPATILVVQLDPDPIPTLMTSTPSSMSFSAPSDVAIFPTTISQFRFSQFIIFSTHLSNAKHSNLGV